MTSELRSLKNGRFILRVALGSLQREIEEVEARPGWLPGLHEAVANIVDALRTETVQAGQDEFWLAGDRAFSSLARVSSGSLLQESPSEASEQVSPLTA